jgi:hypothetical protein
LMPKTTSAAKSQPAKKTAKVGQSSVRHTTEIA